jgi:hypothetical protein
MKSISSAAIGQQTIPPPESFIAISHEMVIIEIGQSKKSVLCGGARIL